MTRAAVAAIIARRERSEIVTEPFEVITVDTDRVACDGGGGALGHPKVYLNLGEAGGCPLLQQSLRAGRRRQIRRPRPLTDTTMKQLGEGWNWRELKIGDRFVTYGRTLFEADLLNFVTLCGFSEELFTNKEYVKEHAPMRGGHPVPGALVYSMAEGLVIPTTLQGTGLAFLSMGFDI